MNLALAEYYGNSVPAEGTGVKTSGDRSRVIALHHMKNVVAGCGGFDAFPKTSQELMAAAQTDENVKAAVEFFGGADSAMTKTAADLSWVQAFADGERDGAELACHSMMALFEHAAETVQS